MLTEHFVASISAPTKANTGVTKDAGIFFHEYQPLAAQRHVFKKSATAPNGLAVSESHIFTAQEGKAVVHVYNREKGNQEIVVPFPERIHSIALAGKGTILLLGTASGRILVWETASGRLVSTSTSHLQPVTCLAVDPKSNFFLSGSTDAMIHVWALPTILSFSPDTLRSPMHTLSTHRGPVTGLACGHSSSTANIAVSISHDKSAIVWDYHNGQALRTYLLPEVPVAVTLDPADRAFYAAYEDGSLHAVSFYDEVQQGSASDTLHDPAFSHRPIQPPTTTRFHAASQKLGGAQSIGLSWDGTALLSGHATGKVAAWDIAKRSLVGVLTSLPGPVTNLQFLEPIGFSHKPEAKFKIHAVVKPKQDSGVNGGTGLVPANYSVQMQFTGSLSLPAISATEGRNTRERAFEEALAHPIFPMSMLEESLAELEAWNPQSNGTLAPPADFLSFSARDADEAGALHQDAKDEELKAVKKQLAALQRIQKATFEQIAELREEREWFLKQQRKDMARKMKLKATTKRAIANGDGDVEMNEASQVSESGESESVATSSGDDEDEDEE